jgi:hypothetical protein
MRRLDFEQAILEMVFDAGYDQLTPATVAFHLKIPIKTAEQYLDELLRDAILEMDLSEAGHITYRLPEASRPPAETLARTRRYRATHGEGGASLMLPAGVVLHPPSHAALANFTPPAPPAPPAPPVPPPALSYHLSAGDQPAGDHFIATLRHHDWSASPSSPNSDWATRAPSYPLTEGHPPRQSSAHNLTRPSSNHLDLASDRRNPTGSMLLSLLWPGLGQVYNGQPGKGVVLFFSSAFLWMAFMGWIVHVYALVDAGLVAQQINRRWHMRRAAALPA